ncbi:response regulator transcription factor [Solibacillus daqui]|uniref:response regulator transcription factor n=1 Tax=Solibacillus daqui TaxID=2912187 RepID=UPI002364FF46|nr:response regulator transcription factor [Solibacillus daqui]
MQQQILLVDPNTQWTDKLAAFLSENSFTVIITSSAEEAMKIFHQSYPCMVIMELNLPNGSGEMFCKWIRANQTADVSIIMVTEKNHVEDKINGLTIGADDYLTKPVYLEELLAHMHAVLRRTGLFCQKIIHNGLCIKPRKGEVYLNGAPIQLTKHEFMLLYYLMDHPNQIISREALIEQLYPNIEKEIFERSIDAHIKKLRAKIEVDRKQPKRIVTVRGEGYKYIPDE